MTATRTAATTLVALALAVLLAVPAAAAPPFGAPRQGPPDRTPGNPVAHCLPDRGGDDTEVPDEDENEVPETDTVTAEVDETYVPEDEGTPSPADSDEQKAAVARCVLASLPDIVGNAHAASIVAVVVRGIANGYADGTYRPQQQVTRGQMATFLARALDLAPAPASGLRDIAGNTHQAAIEAVAAAGIAKGYADGTYRPQQQVTRGQMATFLARALGL
ncbi:MAG TPA: S-layer homology domain-containing protein [Egibacteraceae bacterium]|nr:S-layer homology domain-containing protein [Egibacteraceae bacterium]